MGKTSFYFKRQKNLFLKIPILRYILYKLTPEIRYQFETTKSDIH